MAPVANEDIARTAVAVLMAPGRHDGKTYRPTGPQLLSAADAFFSTRAACAEGRARVTQKRRVTCWPPARLQLERKFCVATILRVECPLWVISGHSMIVPQCPLYLRKRTYIPHAPYFAPMTIAQ